MIRRREQACLFCLWDSETWLAGCDQIKRLTIVTSEVMLYEAHCLFIGFSMLSLRNHQQRKSRPRFMFTSTSDIRTCALACVRNDVRYIQTHHILHFCLFYVQLFIPKGNYVVSDISPSPSSQNHPCLVQPAQGLWIPDQMCVKMHVKQWAMHACQQRLLTCCACVSLGPVQQHTSLYPQPAGQCCGRWWRCLRGTILGQQHHAHKPQLEEVSTARRRWAW